MNIHLNIHNMDIDIHSPMDIHVQLAVKRMDINIISHQNALISWRIHN